MNILKILRDINRERLAKRKTKKEKAIEPRLAVMLHEAKSEFSEFDPAAHGNYPAKTFFKKPRSDFAPPHPSVNEFARLMRECSGAKILLFSPWLSRGGADKVTLTFFRSAQNKYGAGSVKIILTEPDPIRAELPKDVLDNSAFLFEGKDKPADTILVDLTTRLIHFLSPEHCVNINSKTLWDVLLENGKILSRTCKISVAAFCTEVLEDGRESGYAYSHLRECAQYVDHIISDNDSFRDHLRDVGVLSESSLKKWHVIRQPADFDFSFTSIEKKRNENLGQHRARVVWASRICYQKNWEILSKIAEKTPEITFDIWGEGPDEGLLRQSISGANNINIRGAFNSMQKVIQEGNYDAFLYTSRMDGIPNILLEVGASGLPIISSMAGSISDLLSTERAFLVSDHSNATEYAEALRLSLSEPSIAKDRALKLIDFISVKHNIDQAEKSILEII